MNKHRKKNNNLYCMNCGLSGHNYKHCNVPITSYGIILLDLNSENAIGVPGAMGKILRKIANEGISVEFSYGLENNRYVIGVNNLEKAQAALK